MTEDSYVKMLRRVVRNTTAAHGGSFDIRGRTAVVYWSTNRGDIAFRVWLGGLDSENHYRPRGVMVSGPHIVGSVAEVEYMADQYRAAAVLMARVLNRLHDAAVEIPEVEEDDIITEEEDDDEELDG